MNYDSWKTTDTSWEDWEDMKDEEEERELYIEHDPEQGFCIADPEGALVEDRYYREYKDAKEALERLKRWG